LFYLYPIDGYSVVLYANKNALKMIAVIITKENSRKW